MLRSCPYLREAIRDQGRALPSSLRGPCRPSRPLDLERYCGRCVGVSNQFIANEAGVTSRVGEADNEDMHHLLPSDRLVAEAKLTHHAAGDLLRRGIIVRWGAFNACPARRPPRES